MKYGTIIFGSLLLATTIFFQSFAAADAPAQAHQPPAMQHAGHAALDQAGSRMPAIAGNRNPRAWTSYPLLKVRTGGMGGHEQMVATVTPQNLVANSIDAYSNALRDPAMHRQLALELAGAKLDQPGSGGFHWLAAREELGDEVLVASTVYYFSHPGKDPTAMFMQRKHELEIIPQPFPREHSRYRANEEWKFLVRFNGMPLAGQKVSLETQNGSKSEWTSDAQGVIMVQLPDDFANAPPMPAMGGNRMRRSADFVLATEHEAGGRNYLTGFNASYGPDAFDQRSLALGAGFIALGMAGALPLLRQRRQTPEPDAAAPDVREG